MGVGSSGCCARNDDACPHAARKRKHTQTNLHKVVINTDPPRAQIEINLEQTAITQHILQLSTIRLLKAWTSADVTGDGQIHITSGLHLIFLHLIYDYIEHESNRKMNTIQFEYDRRAKRLSSELSKRFHRVLEAKCSGDGSDADKNCQMSKHFYLEHFQQYLCECKEQLQSPAVQNKECTIESCLGEEELGRFIIDKLDEVTAEKLILRLNTSSRKHSASRSQTPIMSNDIQTIEAKQIIYLLVFITVLYLKYKQKTEECDAVKVDNKKLKQTLMPVNTWIMKTKFQQTPSMKKSEYKLLGAWLIEYSLIKTNSA